MESKERVLILMSVYNGGDRIIRQVESILNQKNVITYIDIRDDGSSDSNTLNILSVLEKKYRGRIKCEYGKNIGWKKSFMELLYLAEGEYDYYGFSDQDDLWMDNKIISCIHLMEKEKKIKVKLAHCNSISVDCSFHSRYEQEYRKPFPPSLKSAISTEYFQGCGMLWNDAAMNLIQQYRPQNEDLAHDYWVGLLCYLFGKVFLNEEKLFYHVRYENNASSDGMVLKGRIQRTKLLLQKKNIYMNPAKDLLAGYEDNLKNRDIIFLNRIIDYKEKLIPKLFLIFDPQFCRPTILSTLYFKFILVLNRY